MPSRPYLFYSLTNSLCSACLKKVEAKIIFRDEKVFLVKNCPDHGREEVMIANDIEYYKLCQEYLKPGDMPLRFNTEMEKGCPFDCGLCPDHEQHGCLTLVEITERCNLSCPVCYAGSDEAHGRHRSLAEIEKMLDTVVANEGEVQILQISGGEPTLHPDFFAILDMAKQKPIKHLMVNTNGLRIAGDPEFVRKLSQYQPGFEIYLQFDSLAPTSLKELRGSDLSAIRKKAIEHLNEFNLSTTLVVTLKKGLNDGEMGSIIEYALQQPSVRGIAFQPIQAAGRVEGYDPALERLTLTEIRRKILEQSSHFKPADIIPVPCHPDCLAMGYALKMKGKVHALTSLFDLDTVKNSPNTILFEQNPELKKRLFELFSLSQSPESSVKALGQLLCCLPLVPVPTGLSYQNLFRIMIVQFLDPYNFDVRSAKRSCVHIVHPDGRVIPFDTYNIFHRNFREEKDHESK